MGAVPVVEVIPDGQSRATIVGVGVGTAIGPLAQRRLDETLGFAVGLRSVGSSEFLIDASFNASFPERKRMESGPVVRDQTLDLHTHPGEIRDSIKQEGLCAVFALVRTHASEGDARVIVDGHERVFPTKVLRSFAVVAGNSVTHIGKAPQLLDVDAQ